jgi:DNA-binding MarR family transcriptional regulator
MSSSGRKKSKTEHAPPSQADECMCAMMTTVKMVHKYASAKFSKHPQFNKLSGPRVGVLFIVHEAGAIRMGDLAAKLMVAPRTVTDAIDGLERDGFLRRVPDPSDRRAMLIELTPDVKENFGKIAAMRKQFAEEMFSVFTAEECMEFVRLLTKLQKGPLSKLAEMLDLSE